MRLFSNFVSGISGVTGIAGVVVETLLIANLFVGIPLIVVGCALFLTAVIKFGSDKYQQKKLKEKTNEKGNVPNQDEIVPERDGNNTTQKQNREWFNGVR